MGAVSNGIGEWGEFVGECGWATFYLLNQTVQIFQYHRYLHQNEFQ